MIELDNEVVNDQGLDDKISSVFKLDGGLDINTIPGHYKKEDYEIGKAILNYRDKLQEFRSSVVISVEDALTKSDEATKAMLDLTHAIDKLKLAKTIDGIQTLEPFESALLNIAAGLNQQFKDYIERIENDGRSESNTCCHSHEGRNASERS